MAKELRSWGDEKAQRVKAMGPWAGVHAPSPQGLLRSSQQGDAVVWMLVVMA